MSHYKHITPEEREKILLLFSHNYSITFIAESLGRNKSTISRELSRNSFDNDYSAVTAQAAYLERRKKCRPRKKLDDPVIFEKVREKFLDHQWSPEEISERLNLENAGFSVSYSTIYRGIYSGMFDSPDERRFHGNRGAIRKLRHRGKTRHTKSHDQKNAGNIFRKHKEKALQSDSSERLCLRSDSSGQIARNCFRLTLCIINLLMGKSLI